MRFMPDMSGYTSGRSLSMRSHPQSQGSHRSTDQDNTPAVDIEEYGDLHRYMLQGMISAGVLDAKGVKKLFDGACAMVNLRLDTRLKMPTIQKVVLHINSRIEDFCMAIKSCTCEVTGTKYYIFTMTIESPVVQFQKKFSNLETKMFQRCLDVIICKTDTFSVSQADCFKIIREMDNKTLNLAEDFVEKMLSLLYFVKYSWHGMKGPAHITLGVRTMREFDSVLKQCYHDVIGTCCLCRNPLLQGYNCPNKGACKYLVHIYCYTKYVSQSTECPTCRTSWEPSTKMIRRVKETDEEDDAEEMDESTISTATSFNDLSINGRKN